MAIPLKARRFTTDEYLRLEREADYKSEFYRGEIFAMAGGTARHSLITANIIGTLRSVLKGRRCTAYTSDLRIAIPGEQLYTYPDASVFCGQLEFLPNCDDTALNPTVIVEVLSPGTETYVRGKKFEHYARIATLREYILVAQHAPFIERHTRQDNGWVQTVADGINSILPIEALDLHLPLAEVYDKVDFEAAAS